MSNLPSSIPKLRYNILKIVNENPKILMSDIEQHMPPDCVNNLNKQTHMCCDKKLLIKHGRYSTATLTITKLGRDYLDAIDNGIITIQAVGSKIGIGKGVSKKKPRQQPQPIQPFNISKTAENVTDMIGSLVYENEQYRNLLLKLHKTIGDALGLEDEQATAE